MSAEKDEEVMYEEEEEEETTAAAGGAAGDTYVDLHASGFKEFALKPELAQAIGDCGFEHPSEGKSTAPPAQSRSRAHARSDRALAIGAGN